MDKARENQVTGVIVIVVYWDQVMSSTAKIMVWMISDM